MQNKISLTLLLFASFAFATSHNNTVNESGGSAYTQVAEGYKKDFYYWFDNGFEAYGRKDYKKAIELWDRAYKLADSDALRANCLVNKASAFGAMNKNKEAMALYENVYKKFRQHKDVAVRAYVSNALVGKGYLLGKAGKYKEEIAVYGKLYDEFGGSDDPFVMTDVATGLFAKGYRLDFLKKHKEAIEIYDKIIKEFGDSFDTAVRLQVAKAYASKGYTLGSLGAYAQEVTACDEMIQWFRSDDSHEIRLEVVTSMVNKGWALSKLGRLEEEIANYDDIYSKFGNDGYIFDKTEEIREGILFQVVTSFFNKAYALGSLGRHEEELAMYDRVYSEFIDAQDKAAKSLALQALNNKAIALEKMGQNEDAQKLYLDVIKAQPENIELGTYANLFELYVIADKEIDKNIEKQFLKYAKNNKKAMLPYQMAVTVKASLASEQSKKIAKLKKEYKGIAFGDWSWMEIQRWSETIKDDAAKQRVKATIEVFKNWDKN